MTAQLDLQIRPADRRDGEAICTLLAPVLREGATYALPAEWDREEALSFWFGGEHRVFVAEAQGQVLGTYYLHANQKGGGSQLANCGYVTALESGARKTPSSMLRPTQNEDCLSFELRGGVRRACHERSIFHR